MEATLTLNQAGQQLGVDDDALTRLIQMGALPEARRVASRRGPVWVIPEQHLPSIAARNGWTIDLRASSIAPTGGPITRTLDRGSAIEITESAPPIAGRARTGAVVLRPDGSPVLADGDDGPGAPSVAEVLDLALLDRLLGVQEERVVAEARARESGHALAALNANHNRVTGELEVERRERMVAADRYREERLARAIADAKVAELRDRVCREMALAESEKRAKSEALDRSARAEREAANAVAAMGWLARRRYRRLTT